MKHIDLASLLPSLYQTLLARLSRLHVLIPVTRHNGGRFKGLHADLIQPQLELRIVVPLCGYRGKVSGFRLTARLTCLNKNYVSNDEEILAEAHVKQH